MMTWETVSVYIMDLWISLRVFTIVWMLSVFASTLIYRGFRKKKDFDHLTWFVWPFIFGTFILTPIIYVLAHLW